MLHIPDTQISVANNVISVTMGHATASIPVENLDAFMRILHALTGMTQGGQSAVVASTTPTPLVEVAAAPAQITSVSTVRTAKPKSKRRSRKRVGDALIIWMEENPGWHSEADLLKTVIENKMSDADPKRALKIALGKQRDKIFATDNRGNWCLEKNRATSKSKPSKRSRRTRRTRSKGGKSTTAKKKAHLTDAANAAETDTQEAPARTVLVKRGQNRKQATLAEGEMGARKAASEKLKKPTSKRWQRASRAEVERARKNLLGLGPSAQKVKPPQ